MSLVVEGIAVGQKVKAILKSKGFASVPTCCVGFELGKAFVYIRPMYVKNLFQTPYCYSYDVHPQSPNRYFGGTVELIKGRLLCLGLEDKVLYFLNASCHSYSLLTIKSRFIAHILIPSRRSNTCSSSLVKAVAGCRFLAV